MLHIPQWNYYRWGDSAGIAFLYGRSITGKEGAGYGNCSGYNDKCKWIFEELMFVPYIQF